MDSCFPKPSNGKGKEAQEGIPTEGVQTARKAQTQSLTEFTSRDVIGHLTLRRYLISDSVINHTCRRVDSACGMNVECTQRLRRNSAAAMPSLFCL